MEQKIKYIDRRYSISWHTETGSILFRIEKPYLQKIQDALKTPPTYVRRILNLHIYDFFNGNGHSGSLQTNMHRSFSCRLKSFGIPGQPFGFFEQFKYHCHTEQEFVYAWKLPPIIAKKKTPCPVCKGTARNNTYPAYECHPCRGTGKAHEYDMSRYNSFKAGMLTFHLLTSILNNTIPFGYKFAEDTARRQCSIYEIAFDRITGEPTISGWIDDEMFDWIRWEVEELPVVKQSMIEADKALFVQELKEPDFEFKKKHEGIFMLRVPGNGGRLELLRDTEALNLYEYGKILKGHNMHQMTSIASVIAGLASLEESFRISH